ncbi:uncharacterized protein LOC132952489 [Metopolophium dirhodum]|uniref:uncharacterized protein LOC132952489 n=1 Tax=Metopolophium dirhodum TaxID=44670 RepID=UPI0029907126|nr:uncharacterized protein LOC132952489 [Metopolophium dirhodum]
MMFGTSVPVFVVTLMSLINHSYLIATVELPSIEDKTFVDYNNNIKTATETAMDKQLTDEEFKMILHGRLLCEDQFNKTLKNYNQYTDTIRTNYLYIQIDIELSNFTDEARILKRLGSNGNSHNQTKATANSLRSVWFFLLKKLDPMFGESYISYVIRMINLKKMPLPIDLIPVFYGNGKLQLFEEFDIWPELNAVFVMYFLFNCPFQPSKPSPSQDKPIKATEPIIKHSDEPSE